ncbi:MAG TPA: Ig-like domain-containing protein [Thermoanaerobaculia bacterium]|nr:Ig-like domain-containing protein [Thermoanaerobaculia bacterium]
MNIRVRQIALLFCVVLLVLGTGATLSAQLNDKCTVSVLNRNAQAAADGSWIVPTIPANFGPVRARATCVENGVTRSGESELFTIAPNGSVDVPKIVLGATTPIPTGLTLTSQFTTLNVSNPATQLTVVASYAGGATQNVTSSTTGTTYTISNTAIATITADGFVQAVSSGTAVVQASKEGAAGLLAINVVLSSDTDGDGILDDIELREGLNPNNPTDAFEDLDRDGLSNLDEVLAGTMLRNPDTDGDTLADGEETQAGSDGFVTNPLIADTDGDGLRDGLEVETGSDPTDAQSFNLAAALLGLDVTPPSFTLIVNTINPQAYTQLRVLGELRDGFTIDLTSRARGTQYTSNNVQVCNFGATDGRVFAGSEGGCIVSVANSGHTAAVSGAVRNFSPLALSQLSIPGYANNVDVADDYAYVAAGSAGLQVVDVSDPRLPRIIGSVDTNGNANDVRVLGRYAYIADGSAGVKIIDVVNPALPVIVGAVDTPGDAFDIVVAGNLAYVADSFAGMTIVNVASPTAPILVATIDTPGTARGVDVSGNYAVVIDDGSSSLRVIDISNAAQPRNVGSVAISGSGKDVRANGTIAWIAAYTGGVQVVDFTTPTAPRVIGGLPGSDPTGFVPRDVELAGPFALFAEQLFPNALPIVSTTIPSAPVMRGVINFSPLGDYAGTGVAVAGAFVYMTGESFIVGPENGTTGNTRLFIGQYLPVEDLAGVAPDVTIESPTSATRMEGSPVTVRVAATDDVAIGFVTISIDGQIAYTDSTEPYEYTFDVPSGVDSVTVDATAVDLANNVGSATVTFQVIPDPLTTVAGVVVDENGVPLAGATVTTFGGRSGTTTSTGAFSIFGVPTVRGDLIASASYLRADGTTLQGSSMPVPPVASGVTNVGTIAAVPAVFETNFGTLVSRIDDDYYLFNLPFAFPYYGTTQTQAFVGTNGYITFGSGDWTYTETLPGFSSVPRIAAFFDDLYARSTGAMYVNASLPGRFVVTHDRVQHYSFGGSNTIQMTLYADGRILFAYRGITALNTGTVIGITPGPNSAFEQVDYSTRTNFDVAPDTSIYEYFTNTNLFDLDFSYILYTRRGDGTYNVRTLLPPPAASTSTITGGPASASAVAGSPAAVASNAVQAQSVFGKAEVEVRSSGDVHWRGMTNTDPNGRFTIADVPPGGIVVKVTKKGKVVAEGAALLKGNGEKKHIVIENPRPEKKDRNQ